MNQITRELANEGITTRSAAFCPGDKKVKFVNQLVDVNKFTPMNKTNTIDIDQQANVDDEYKKKWYWEGNIQDKIVQWLKTQRFLIHKVANTENKEAGTDIIAINPEKRRLLVSVKGFPNQRNKNKSTQARHWFAEAIFDLVLYRKDYPEVDLAVGLPEGFQTYQNLSKKVAWFKESLPFIYFWASEDENVKEC